MTMRVVGGRAPRLKPGVRPVEVTPGRHVSLCTLLHPYEPWRVEAACARFNGRYQHVKHPSYRPRLAVRDAIKELPTASNEASFCEALDKTFEAIRVSGHRPQHALELAVLLREEGCLLLPLGLVQENADTVFDDIRGRGYKSYPALAGPAGALFDRVCSAEPESETRADVGNLLFCLLVTSQGLAEGATISEASAREKFRILAGANRLTYLRRLLRHFGDGEIGAPPSGAPRMSRSDRAFRWVTAANPALEPWRSLAESWVAGLRSARVDGQVAAANQLFDLMLSDAGLQRPPTVGLKEPNPLRVAILARMERAALSYRRELTGYLIDFFDAALRTLRQRDPSLRSPISFFDKPASSPQPTQTPRTVMADARKALCIEILTRDDYAWPKTFASDWFCPRADEALVWSPVRAFVILAVLQYPGRISQFLRADSGEGDPKLFCDRTLAWVPNELATRKHGEYRGIQRQIVDPETRRVINGFHINTNKGGAPFDVHWELASLHELVRNMRDWQIRHNAILEPTPFSVTEAGRRASEQVVRRAPSLYYLFRDPGGQQGGAPVRYDRVRAMWLALMDELEKELRARGECTVDGSPVEVITRRDHAGKPVSALYDLHGQRVTGITKLSTAGVPDLVIGRTVGQRRIAQTAHYIKHDPAETTSQLLRASARGSNVGVGGPLARAVTGSGSEPSEMGQLQSVGICPNGRTLCDELAPRLAIETRGSPAQCGRCPALVSGPAFAPALIAARVDQKQIAAAAHQDWQASQRKLTAIEDHDPYGRAAEEARRADARAQSGFLLACKSLAGLTAHAVASAVLLRGGGVTDKGVSALVVLAPNSIHGLTCSTAGRAFAKVALTGGRVYRALPQSKEETRVAMARRWAIGRELDHFASLLGLTAADLACADRARLALMQHDLPSRALGIGLSAAAPPPWLEDPHIEPLDTAADHYALQGAAAASTSMEPAS